jgi:hypothetical protein
VSPKLRIYGERHHAAHPAFRDPAPMVEHDVKRASAVKNQDPPAFLGDEDPSVREECEVGWLEEAGPKGLLLESDRQRRMIGRCRRLRVRIAADVTIQPQPARRPAEPDCKKDDRCHYRE